MRRHFVGHAVSTPGTLDSGGRPRALPDDLLRDASRRLAVIALLGAVLWVVGTVLGHLAAGERHLAIPDAIAAASALVSLALFLHARRCPHGPHVSLDLGLLYMMFTAAALAMSWHWSPIAGMPVNPMISWIGVVVLMFAAIVPSTPMKTLVSSLIAVAMNPIAMAWRQGSTANVLVMHYPDFLLAGVAVVISHVMTKLGRHVAKAREMGSYELGELLGRGGMGEVYKATHRMLARPAAIKLIRPEMLGAARGGESSAVIAQRFRREAEAAANLRSPHTVELYDFGVTEDGTMYFVMELLEGMDLQSLVAAHGALPAGRAIAILRQICASLEEAHARGLVHRDVKPANIHVGRLGLEHDFVKVLDFGLVKSVAANTEQSLATAAGSTPGTPAYMAPEMALGQSVDARADIYALGGVAYFLLTGATVFESSNAYSAIAMLLRDEPAPPSQRTDNPIPPALDRLVVACLAKRPYDRPNSVAEISRALAAIDVAPWGEEQAREWWSSERKEGEVVPMPLDSDVATYLH